MATVPVGALRGIPACRAATQRGGFGESRLSSFKTANHRAAPEPIGSQLSNGLSIIRDNEKVKEKVKKQAYLGVRWA